MPHEQNKSSSTNQSAALSEENLSSPMPSANAILAAKASAIAANHNHSPLNKIVEEHRDRLNQIFENAKEAINNIHRTKSNPYLPNNKSKQEENKAAAMEETSDAQELTDKVDDKQAGQDHEEASQNQNVQLDFSAFKNRQKALGKTGIGQRHAVERAKDAIARHQERTDALTPIDNSNSNTSLVAKASVLAANHNLAHKNQQGDDEESRLAQVFDDAKKNINHLQGANANPYLPGNEATEKPSEQNDTKSLSDSNNTDAQVEAPNLQSPISLDFSASRNRHKAAGSMGIGQHNAVNRAKDALARHQERQEALASQYVVEVDLEGAESTQEDAAEQSQEKDQANAQAKDAAKGKSNANKDSASSLASISATGTGSDKAKGKKKAKKKKQQPLRFQQLAIRDAHISFAKKKIGNRSSHQDKLF